MTVKNLSFGSITIDGETYIKDVIIDIKHINDPHTNLILHLTC